MKAASSLPRRRRSVRYSSETATGRSVNVPVPPSVAHGLGERWTATLEPLDSRAEDERDQGTATLTARPPAGKPKSTPTRKPTFLQRESDGRRFRKPGARVCPLERSSGSWETTEPPSRNTWALGGLQRGDLGPVQRRQHLIPWQPNQVTFMLNTWPDIYPEQRHPGGTPPTALDSTPLSQQIGSAFPYHSRFNTDSVSRGTGKAVQHRHPLQMVSKVILHRNSPITPIPIVGT